MTEICEGCEQSFSPKRSDQRHCSARCRVRVFRRKRAPEPAETVTGPAEAVTDLGLLVTRERRVDSDSWSGCPDCGGLRVQPLVFRNGVELRHVCEEIAK